MRSTSPKRHVALRGLSLEHHAALAMARRLSHAGEPATRRGDPVGEFLRYAHSDLAQHLRQEEEVLFPEFARTAGVDDPLLARALREHLAIRSAILELERCTLDGSAVDATLLDLASAIEAHILFEERQLYPAIEKGLSEERLAAVGVLVATNLHGAVA